jgi:hypothetical protein
MFVRPITRQSGLEQPAGPGNPTLAQLTADTLTTIGAGTVLAQSIAAGWLKRSGPVGGFTDTFPTVTSILAAMPDLCVGDSFMFIYHNLTAQAMTFAGGTGMVTGSGTLDCGASKTLLYIMTVLSTKLTYTATGKTNNATKILNGFSSAKLANIQPGMGVTGTGIGASAVVVGLSYGDGSDDETTGGTVTVDVVSTATASNIAITFNPRMKVDSLGVLAAS